MCLCILESHSRMLTGISDVTLKDALNPRFKFRIQPIWREYREWASGSWQMPTTSWQDGGGGAQQHPQNPPKWQNSLAVFGRNTRQNTCNPNTFSKRAAQFSCALDFSIGFSPGGFWIKKKDKMFGESLTSFIERKANCQ